MYIDAFDIIEEALKYRNEFKSFLRKTLNTFISGKRIVHVYGPGGVGKTTFAKRYVNSAVRTVAIDSPSSYGEPEDESLLTEEFPIKEYHGGLIVLPGQEWRARRQWPKFTSQIRDGKVNGIIYFCCYGYHSMDLPYKDNKWFEKGDSRDGFIERYTKVCREKEIDLFKHYLAAPISEAKRAPWIFLIVCKQDLWWDRRLEVRNYYKNGAFPSLIEEIDNERNDGGRIQFEVSSISSRIENFVDGNGSVIATTSPGYDEKLKRANMAQTLRNLDRLINSR
jgi:hypothetical protein